MTSTLCGSMGTSQAGQNCVPSFTNSRRRKWWISVCVATVLLEPPRLVRCSIATVGGIPKIASTLGISEAEAQAVADTLDALAPGVARWSAQMRNYVRDGGTSFRAYSGRVVWLDRGQPHKAANYAIQGSAREFLADGLLNWRGTAWGGCTVLPVHDEVLSVVPAEQADGATAALVACMQTELAEMPIVAEPSQPSFAWQDAS